MAAPKIRFKKNDGSDYPAWQEKPLKDLFPYIRNGFVGTVTDYFTDKEHGVRYLEGTNIHDGFLSDTVDLYVTKDFHEKHVNSQLKDNDIVMVQSGHVGDCAVIREKYSGSNCHALIIMSNGGECCSQFFVDYFHSIYGKNKISVVSTGNTVKHVLASVMQEFPVPVPCLEEQQKIADFLSDVDELINASEDEITNLEMQKKAAMKKIFSQEVRFKKPDGGAFPDWEIHRMAEISSINPRCEELPSEFYYMDLGSVDHGVWKTKSIVMKEDAPSRAQRTAKYNDIFFQSVRPYNMGHFHVTENYDKAVVASTGYIQLRVYNQFNAAYVYQLLYENLFNEQVNARCTGSNYPAINSDNFSEIKVPSPSLEEQRLIADFLSSFDEAINAAKEELTKYRELKKGLLQQMFI